MEGLAKIAGFVGTVPTGKKEVAEHLKKRKEQEKINKKVFEYLKQNYPEDCVFWSTLVDWELKDVSLEDIKMARRPGGAREMDKVKGIAQAVKDGKAMEPVVLVKLPDGTVKIADGYHRTLGFKHADKAKIKAWIAPVPDSKGPWDKEMHERKLNVGKKASEMELGLAKLAELTNDEKGNLGLAGAGAGAYAIHKSVPMLDGMERYYHGTNKENGKGIREAGLLANRAGEGKATQRANLAQRIGEEPLKGKVYIGKPGVALDVGLQQSGFNPGNLDLVKMKIPYQHFKDGTLNEVDNPELRGLSEDDWVKAIKKEVFLSPPEAQLRGSYRALSAPNTRTIEGDIGTEYIKGSKDYKGQNLAGLVDYITNNPKRFAGGVGLAGLGAAGVGTGLYYAYPRPHEKTAREIGLAGLEKQASLLGLLGLGTAMHVAPNLAMKGVKSTQAGQNALAGTFSAGVEMGRTKRKMHPNLQSVLEYGVGPESTVDYNLGRKLGSRISDMEPERQERFLSKAKGMFNSHVTSRFGENADEVNKVPIINSVKHYFDGHGENKVKNLFVKTSVPEDQALTWKNKLGNVGALGLAGAVDPHLLLQPALSGARKQLAKSELGAKVFEKNFKAGHEGKPLSKLKETAIDMTISPAVLDSYRIGKAMNKHLPDEANAAFKEQVNVKDAYQKMLAPR